MQRQLDVGREVYNACLEERRACYKATGKSLTYYDQANQLKAIRQECPDKARLRPSHCGARRGTGTPASRVRPRSRRCPPQVRAWASTWG
ncbi:MAG: hypothetical protein M3Y74_20300 [Chloroflexota bacterium]|nr:hypothetical protein [Chloroflexota bacterium]